VILASLGEAQRAGARLHAACGVVGISARTIERWKRPACRGRPTVRAAAPATQCAHRGRGSTPPRRHDQCALRTHASQAAGTAARG
jgi:hypothetical protein